MCQRQIIYHKNDQEEKHTVPLMNGCNCSMIKEFRHIGLDIATSIPQDVYISHSRPRKEYHLPEGCFDMHSSIPIPDVPGHHVVFRNCICGHPSGLCMKLPPLLYQPENDDFDTADMDDEDDEDDNSWGGNMGIRPMP